MMSAHRLLNCLVEAEPVTQLDRTSAKQLHAEAERRMQALAQELDLTCRAKGSSYDPNAGVFSFRCEFKLKVVGGLPSEQAEFNRHCELFGLEERDYGAVVTINHEQWKLTGLRPNRPKFPFAFTRLSDGRQSLFTEIVADRIKAARGASAAA